MTVPGQNSVIKTSDYNVFFTKNHFDLTLIYNRFLEHFLYIKKILFTPLTFDLNSFKIQYVKFDATAKR